MKREAKNVKFVLIVLSAILIFLVFIKLHSKNFFEKQGHVTKKVKILNKKIVLDIGEEKFIFFNKTYEVLNCTSKNKYFLEKSISCSKNVTVTAAMIGKYNIKVFLRNLKSRDLILYNVTVCIGKSRAQGNLLCGVRK